MNKLLILPILFILSQSILAQEYFQSNRLHKIWETSVGLETPESAYYHKPSDKIYVSNIAGKGWEKDSVGFISILNANGEFEKLKWVEGLHAPKGIGIYKERLYVSDIDRLVEIDIPSGRILKTYTHFKAVNLNDVAIDNRGLVYVTDSKNKCIFFLKNDSLQLFLESEELVRLNGIFIEGNLLLCGTNDSKFISIDKKKKTIAVLRTDVPYIDGLIKVDGGNYIASNFKGLIVLIDVKRGVEKLLDSTINKVNAADLGYIKKSKLILVPTFNNHKLLAYTFKD